MLKRVGLAFLAGTLTFLLLVAFLSPSTSAPISVLGDGDISFTATMTDANGLEIRGSSIGGGYGTSYNTEYAITYGDVAVASLSFKVAWDITGENIDSLAVAGRLYHIDNSEQDLLTEFSSSAFLGEKDLGAYPPSSLLTTLPPEGSFHIDFRMVVMFDAVGEDGTMHYDSVISDVKMWMYNSEQVRPPPDKTTAIEGITLDDSSYTGDDGIYDTYDPLPPDRYIAASITSLSAGSMIAGVFSLVVAYAIFRSVK